MKHSLTLTEVDGSKWWECDDCNCSFVKGNWWINGMMSKVEPECSADNLDWERQAEDGGLKWN